MVAHWTGRTALAVDATGAAANRSFAGLAAFAAMGRIVSGETLILIFSHLTQMAVGIAEHVACTVHTYSITT